MARINPLSDQLTADSTQQVTAKSTPSGKPSITNTRATLAHSPAAADAYMQWYPLYNEVEKILGKRIAYIYAYSISNASEGPLCSTYFRKEIIDAGETPDALKLTASEQCIMAFGNCIASYRGNIADHVYNCVASQFTAQEIVVLVAFAGQMIATNIFNNVIETDIDDYLFDYVPPVKYALR